MEAYAVINMVYPVYYSFHHHWSIINSIASDNDRKMQAVVKSLSRGFQYQVMRSSKENLEK